MKGSIVRKLYGEFLGDNDVIADSLSDKDLFDMDHIKDLCIEHKKEYFYDLYWFGYRAHLGPTEVEEAWYDNCVDLANEHKYYIVDYVITEDGIEQEECQDITGVKDVSDVID